MSNICTKLYLFLKNFVLIFYSCWVANQQKRAIMIVDVVHGDKNGPT